jgi:hypothetical protein
VLLICAGAVMGDSELSDYRDNHGFWKVYPALEQEGLTLMELLLTLRLRKMLSELGASMASGNNFIIKPFPMKAFKY